MDIIANITSEEREGNLACQLVLVPLLSCPWSHALVGCSQLSGHEICELWGAQSVGTESVVVQCMILECMICENSVNTI